MTDEQYIRYIEETLPEEEYRQILEEGWTANTINTVKNGVQKGVNWIKNKVSNAAAGPSAQDRWNTVLNNAAYDIIHIVDAYNKAAKASGGAN